MPLIRALVMAMLAVVLTAAAAQADTKGDAEPAVKLKVGDAAPSIKSAKWVKGESIAEFEKGKIYVVEFWATWCGPCVANIPHLSELQNKYKDVVFIGIDCWEDNLPGVLKLVTEMGDKMSYRVARDDAAKGSIANAWLTAAGCDAIPAAFIIDKDGKIAWIGHPQRMEATLKEIIKDSKDSTGQQKPTNP